MATQTVPQNTDTAPIPIREVTRLILAASDEHDLPFPHEIRRNGDTDLLCLSFRTLAEIEAWRPFFGADEASSGKVRNGEAVLYTAYRHKGRAAGLAWAHDNGPGWNGWSVGLYATETTTAVAA